MEGMFNTVPVNVDMEHVTILRYTGYTGYTDTYMEVIDPSPLIRADECYIVCIYIYRVLHRVYNVHSAQ